MENKLVRLPIGVSDFKELTQENYCFVDKTLFVKEVIDDGAKVILITRPRRFGKTLNLSMLHRFLRQEGAQENNLFENLNIAKDSEFCKKYQNKYPVIFISFKGIKQANYDDAHSSVAVLIKRLHEEHRHLLEDDTLSNGEKKTFMDLLNNKESVADLEESIRQLSVYLERKFNKPAIILIDEYDTPIQEAYLNKYYDDMVGLMRGILGNALKDNTSLAKAVLTGITRVSQESMFSGLNNISVYSLLREKYGQYFGFTEEEVIKLTADTNQTIPLASIKEWYNGYNAGKHVLYNPWSIISCLANHGELRAYWVNTSNDALIRKLLSKANPVIKHQFEELLQGKIIEQPLAEGLVFPNIETKVGALWSLLLYAGYLKVLSSKVGSYQIMAKLAIPNKEVGFVYDKIISEWFGDIISLESYESFVQSLAKGDLEKFKMYLSRYIMQSGSYFDFNDNTSEQIFHMFILGLVVGLRDSYYIYSNRESGLGRFDVVLIPHDKSARGILLEFKTSDTAEQMKDKASEALEQIKDKQYFEEFKQHGVKSVLAIGLAFCGKQVEFAPETIELSK